MKRLAVGFALIAAFGCAPLTFSEPGAIDFARYRTACVTGDGADYLAAELTKTSGFASVTTEPTASVDLILHVSVFFEEHTECDCECECDDTCTCDTDYEATAAFEANTPSGTLVDAGTENDTSETRPEALEDVLDEVAFHYIRAYRL